MKLTLKTPLLIGLCLMVLLTGCMRSRVGNPGAQPAAATNPPASTQAAMPATFTPAATEQTAATSTPSAPAQSQPTATSAVIQITAVKPAAAATEAAKAADDLSNMLDDLTKDLNSSDNLNDVK
jgi:hypothetical protein